MLPDIEAQGSADYRALDAAPRRTGFRRILMIVGLVCVAGMAVGLLVNSTVTSNSPSNDETGATESPIELATDAGQFCFSEVSVIAFFVFDFLLIVFVAWCCKRSGGAAVTRNAVRSVDPKAKMNLDPPIIIMPEVDIEAGNGIEEVCFGRVDDGVEVTIVFADEDRPNKFEDFVYDHIRMPLFGRTKDIESFTFLEENGKFTGIRFTGTHSGDQDWTCKVPNHGTTTVPLSSFKNDNGRTVIYCNVWNHLFGEKNNNPTMKMAEVKMYPCSKGTRKDVDGRYCGLISKIA